MFNRLFSYCLAGVFLCIMSSVRSQSSDLGLFEGHRDIGEHVKPGAATYIGQTGQYVISGAGYNIWLDHDEFHFVYRKMKGDFILYARAAFVGAGVEQHRKIGWMVRRTLDGNAPHINAVEHGDGLTSLQFRRSPGAKTEEKKSSLTHADVIQLERRAGKYIMRVARYGEPFVQEEVSDLDLGDEVYVGLFVGSHNVDVLETGIFHDVRITVPFAGETGERTPMILGSRLELLDIVTGSREVVLTVPHSIQAPNWAKDNTYLIFNDNKGRLYHFNLASREASPLETGDAKNNNNDHVFSFDGSRIGLSSNVKERGGSVIYTVPAGGGKATLVTPKGPSYLHGWSPDGKYLVFCGSRNQEFDVYRVPSAGGEEVKLTNASGLDDGPEYSPDGKYIYFNSVRSGTMQLWRMKPDGSAQEQVTSDDFQNWFPHISPDGKWIVFLSFLKNEVKADQHPPYKQVYIRMMPTAGGAAKVLAYVYGGQGTINTPSWSPDSKKIAFISNSNAVEN